MDRARSLSRHSGTLLVTEHALMRYQRRVRRGATREELVAAVEAAVERPRPAWMTPSPDWHRGSIYRVDRQHRGVVFVLEARPDDDVLALVTVVKDLKQRFRRERRALVRAEMQEALHG